MAETPAEVKQELESTLDSVDYAEELVMRAAREMGFTEDQQHEIGISLRECMVNAVVHGNRYSSRKKVHFAVMPIFLYVQLDKKSSVQKLS